MRNKTHSSVVPNAVVGAKRNLALGTELVLSFESAADIEARRRKGRCGDWRLGSWG